MKEHNTTLPGYTAIRCTHTRTLHAEQSVVYRRPAIPGPRSKPQPQSPSSTTDQEQQQQQHNGDRRQPQRPPTSHAQPSPTANLPMPMSMPLQELGLHATYWHSLPSLPSPPSHHRLACASLSHGNNFWAPDKAIGELTGVPVDEAPLVPAAERMKAPRDPKCPSCSRNRASILDLLQ